MFEVILGFAILFSLFAMAFNAEGVAKWWKRVPRLTKVSFGLFVLAWIMWATGEGTFAWIPQDPSTYNLVFPAYFTAGKIAAGLGLAILITSLFLPVRRKR